MDKIAIISDVHGNITALNEVFKDIESRGITKIYCLGDMVIKCSAPEKCVEKILDKCEVVVRGNCEERVVLSPRIEEHFWNQNRLSEKQKEKIKNLPLYYDFYMSGLKIRLMHASPNSVFEKSYYWNFDEEFENRMVKMFKNSEYLNNIEAEEPNVVIFGHIHRPMLLKIKDKTLINPGAVSNTSDMITKNGKSYTFGSYLIIEGELNSKKLSQISYKIVKFTYDFLHEAENIKKTDMPSKQEAALELETGKYFNRSTIYHKKG